MKKNKEYKLGNIATINFGLHKRAGLAGSVKYLQASHFDENYQPKGFKESFIDLAEKEKRFLLQPNEVILTGKGSRLFAWAYNPDFGQVVPSSLFYILQIQPDLIHNEYLAYYLNSEQMQHQLLTIGSGATIMSIPKKELQHLKITIPPLADQQRMVKILNTLDKDILISTEIIEAKKRLKKGLLNEFISNNL